MIITADTRQIVTAATGLAVDAPKMGYQRGRWPRFNGLPIPWVTRIDPDGPAWARVDLPLLLDCQVRWRCQVCGRPLPARVSVALTTGRDIVSDTAMHQSCALVALRWCPYLIDPHNGVELAAVRFDDIHADGVPLPATMDYGDSIRAWAVPTRPVELKSSDPDIHHREKRNPH